MSTWYRVSAYSWDVKPVEVKSESKTLVTLESGRRVKKVSSWEHFYPDGKLAFDALRKRAEVTLKEAEATVIEMKKLLADINPDKQCTH